MTAPALAASTPCAACPWRLDNHGKPHKNGWYTKANRRRLWVGLRRGVMMSCHPTDENNPLPEGARPVPEGTQVRECSGALILQQREVMVLQECGDYKAYRAARPGGLLRDGIAEVLARALFGGVPVVGGPEMAKPDLNAPVGHDSVPWPFEAPS